MRYGTGKSDTSRHGSIFSASYGFAATLVALALLATFGSVTTVLAQEGARAGLTTQDLQRLVDDLRGRLSIPEPVVVSIVTSNPLFMSVQAPTDRPGAFHLAVEEAFLESLAASDVEAAIAHELGHVWVFTHHPYLQTEQLANQIAMRAVTREDLERVYEKVWKRADTKGDLSRFLGPQSVAGLAPANDLRQ